MRRRYVSPGQGHISEKLFLSPNGDRSRKTSDEQLEALTVELPRQMASSGDNCSVILGGGSFSVQVSEDAVLRYELN